MTNWTLTSETDGSIGVRTLYPFAISFRKSPRAKTLIEWTRFYPSLAHCNADIADVIRREYPNTPLSSINATLHLGFYPHRLSAWRMG